MDREVEAEIDRLKAEVQRLELVLAEVVGWDRVRDAGVDGGWHPPGSWRDQQGRWHLAGEWQDQQGYWHPSGWWQDQQGRWHPRGYFQD